MPILVLVPALAAGLPAAQPRFLDPAGLMSIGVCRGFARSVRIDHAVHALPERAPTLIANSRAVVVIG